jgi:hypothetical protein
MNDIENEEDYSTFLDVKGKEKVQCSPYLVKNRLDKATSIVEGMVGEKNITNSKGELEISKVLNFVLAYFNQRNNGNPETVEAISAHFMSTIQESLQEGVKEANEEFRIPESDREFVLTQEDMRKAWKNFMKRLLGGFKK